MYRWDIINHLIKENNYKSYLEIGYYKGWSFDRVECNNKTAVDPNPSQTLGQENMPYGHIETISTLSWEKNLAKMTSDEFFERPSGQGKWDVVFIDGLHESKQVTKDIENSLKHLNPGGTIVMHDCNPSTEEMTLGGTKDGEWTGDVYKAFIEFRMRYPNYAYVVDTDYGVGIIKEKFDRNRMYASPFGVIPTWEMFDKNRQEYLNLTSVEGFLTWETKVLPSSPHFVKQI